MRLALLIGLTLLSLLYLLVNRIAFFPQASE
jgi:hypothetical protein